MNNTKKEVLRVTNLKQYFKSGSGRNKMIVKAVDDISFSIYEGEVFSLVGESGCGKTTTGRTIINLYPSSGGEVFFHGKRIISDVKAAKADYKAALNRLKEIKTNSQVSLKDEVGSNSISEDEYRKEMLKLNKSFDVQKEAAYSILHKAKIDRNFASYTDAESKQAGKDFNVKSEQHIVITAKYTELNKIANTKLLEAKAIMANTKSSKGQKAKAKKDIKILSKDLRLNKLRLKQDLQRHKYTLLNKNRLLMRKMQMIFQDPIASLNPRMTVKEIIAEGLRINGVKNEEIISKEVDEALTTVGLVSEHASRYPHEFSGGQRQRIGIARALVVEPTLLIADEPISALDVSIRAQIINLLNDLRVEKNITILFIAHDLSVVKYFSDRVAVMYFGKIVEIGVKEKIFNNPFHPYTLSLMESIPLPDPTYEKLRGDQRRYDPINDHDYTNETPILREIEDDHFVLCNTVEFAKYKKQLDNR